MVRRLALSEGMDPWARASDIIEAVRYKRELRRQENMAMAISIFNGVAICVGGGDTDAVIAPFLTTKERDQRRREREDAEQLAAQRAQVLRLMQWGKRHG